MSLLGYPKIIPTPSLTLWDHSFLSYAVDIEQTDKQTLSNVLPMLTNIVSMGSKQEVMTQLAVVILQVTAL